MQRYIRQVSSPARLGDGARELQVAARPAAPGEWAAVAAPIAAFLPRCGLSRGRLRLRQARVNGRDVAGAGPHLKGV